MPIWLVTCCQSRDCAGEGTERKSHLAARWKGIDRSYNNGSGPHTPRDFTQPPTLDNPFATLDAARLVSKRSRRTDPSSRRSLRAWRMSMMRSAIPLHCRHMQMHASCWCCAYEHTRCVLILLVHNWSNHQTLTT